MRCNRAGLRIKCSFTCIGLMVWRSSIRFSVGHIVIGLKVGRSVIALRVGRSVIM